MSNAPKFGFVVEYVKDIDAATRFYVDVMGLELQRTSPTFVQFQNFAVATDQPLGGKGEPELYWLVDDAQAAFDDMSRKANVIRPLEQLPFGRVFGIEDADGRPRFVLELAANRPSRPTT
jgi:catechol 2,3-dioxygenase-like lactoylglutathione lyase family enzyme